MPSWLRWGDRAFEFIRDRFAIGLRPFRRLTAGHQSISVGQEKGIDIRIALDIVSSIRRNECDVAVVFSQDQDLSEVAEEVREIAREQGRWVKIACAFPDNPGRRNRRGIDRTDWLPIDRAVYDACLDFTDYRSRRD